MPALTQTGPYRTLSRLRTGLVALVVGAMVCSTTAHAGGIIRDAETEALIRSYAKPIFRAAGLGSQNIKIHLVNDRNFNAFVVDGHNMFMHAGTLMEAKTPNQVIGVIAHESGHITGGHLARLRNQMSKAKSTAMMLQLLGLAAMAGGAIAGAPDVGKVGMGAAFGGMDSTMRSVLAYRQIEESSDEVVDLGFRQQELRREESVLTLIEARITKMRTEMRTPARVTLMRPAKAPLVPSNKISYFKLIL